MIRHCSKASLRSRCILAGLVGVVALLLITSTCVAFDVSNFGLTEEDLHRLAPPVAERVRDTLESVSGFERDEERRAIDLVLVEELPAEIRKKLTIRRAEVAADTAEAVALYGSLLDDSNPLVDSNLRARIIYETIGYGSYGLVFDRLQRIDTLMAPLLAIPANEYDLGAISTITIYAEAVKSLGYEVASPLLDPDRVEGSPNDLKAHAAQVRMFYALKSRNLVTPLIEIVEKQLRDQGGAKSLPPQQGPHEDDPLTSHLNSLHRTLDSAQWVIDRSLSHLDRNGEVYSEPTALELIERYNLKSPEPIPAPEPKTEAELAAEQEEKERARAQHLEDVVRRSNARIAADTEREYGSRSASTPPTTPSSTRGGFGAILVDSDETSGDGTAGNVESERSTYPLGYIVASVGALFALVLWFVMRRHEVSEK